MTKNFLQMMTVLLTIAVMSVSLTACGSDGDDSSGSGIEQTPHPSYFGTMGKRLKSIENVYHDQKQKVSYFYKGELLDSVVDDLYSSYTLHFDESQKSCQGKHRFRYWRDFMSNLRYDHLGHVVYIGSQTAEYDADSSMGDMYFIYDAEGRLIRIENKSSNGQMISEWELTWQNDTITQLVCTSSDEGETSSRVYNFVYQSRYRNVSRQFTNYLWQALYSIKTFIPLSYIGFMGQGPAYLPVKVITTYRRYEDGQLTTGGGERELEYTFNNDGTVAKEKWASSDSYYQFTYE